MIDPITLAVLAGRMEQIADEMDATLFRAAFNPIIAEAHDASHGLYHATTGDTLVQGKSGLPIFVGVMSFAVKAVIDKAATDGDLADGDIYIFNDAHIGGTHLSDMRLVRPYFRDGKLFCYLASVGHWHDVGGAVPGNYNPSATEAFQEAFVLPPVKLARAGEVNQDIIDILLRNTRLPQSAMSDLNGQLGALDLGVKRLDELLAEYGSDTVGEALDALQDRAERLMRAELDDLPNGDGKRRITSTTMGSPTLRCRSKWPWKSLMTAWFSTSMGPPRPRLARSTLRCPLPWRQPMSRSSTSSSTCPRTQA